MSKLKIHLAGIPCAIVSPRWPTKQSKQVREYNIMHELDKTTCRRCLVYVIKRERDNLKRAHKTIKQIDQKIYLGV